MNFRRFFGAAALAWCMPALLLAQGSFQLPEYSQFKLKNGLTVYLMEQHEVPVINFGAVFRAGAVHDGDKSGLASLTAEGLMFGTKNFTKDQIEETADFYGASIYALAGKESAALNARFSTREAAKIWDILRELLMAPVFDDVEFGKRKERKLAELEQARESPRSVINGYWDRFLYGKHVFGNPEQGTKEGVKALTAEDLKAFHSKHYRPANGALVVVGDFKAAEMKKHLTTLLKEWRIPAGAKNARTETPDLNFKSSRVLLVNKGDSHETRFLIGGKGVPKNHPDYVGIQVVNTILGGRFTSWLNAELRINSGLSYGARSRFYEHSSGGSFAISSFTKTSTTVEAIDLALKVLDKLHAEGPDAATMESARNYIKGSFPPRFESAAQLVALLSDFFIYDVDAAFINNFEKQVDAMTAAKAKEIIRKYFPKDQLQFVLIGRAEEIRDGVRKYGEITEKEITKAGF